MNIYHVSDDLFTLFDGMLLSMNVPAKWTDDLRVTISYHYKRFFQNISSQVSVT